jgi:hypothetical protein
MRGWQLFLLVSALIGVGIVLGETVSVTVGGIFAVVGLALLIMTGNFYGGGVGGGNGS